MLLHRGGDPDPLTRRILYPLWDANLKVGHAVRTVAESRDAGLERLETLTSLLSARLVAGDEELFADLMAAVSDLIRTHPLSSRLVAQERERRAVEPYPTMTADVKEGRGALRTHQGFWWERRRAELVGLDVDVPGQNEVEARASLLSIRNALHAAAGRAMDRFVVDLRDSAARWLETDVYSLAAAMTAALDAGDRLADRRWPDLHVDRTPLAGFRRRVFATIRSRFTTSDEPPVQETGVLAIAVKAASRPDGARLTRTEAESVRTAAASQWTAADRTAFVTLLSGGPRGRAIFGRLAELGWVAREFPEWGPVATAPQLAPFHDHPVGAHLWRTVDEMLSLVRGKDEIGALADEVGSTEELLLAAFLHDIGKARGGNHEIVGAELAAEFMRRVGFGPATSGIVTDAVRLHLLLSETATRRDTADRAVIDEVATQVGDLHRLQVLYLLTIADLRATGTTMWNDWRATLLHDLYRNLSTAITAGRAPRATPDIDAIMAIAGPMLDRRAVEEHVAAMPAEYLDEATPREVIWHLEVAADLEGPTQASVDSEDPGRVLVVGRDRSGFLLAVTRAFTANGVEVMEARLRTRSDGVALDTFRVRDELTKGVIAADRWDRVVASLLASLSDQHALQAKIREKTLAYRVDDYERDALEVRGREAGQSTVVEVRAPDRFGLLTRIVEALHGEGLDVHLARVDTMGGRARDVFYVRRVGVPIRAGPELTALVGRLRDRLRG